MKKRMIRYGKMLSSVSALAVCVLLLCVGICSCDAFDDTNMYAVVSENNLSKDGYYYTLYENNSAMITGVKDPNIKKAEIPSAIDGSYSVVSIGENVFAGCANLKYVSMGEGIRSVGQGAFRECYELLRVDLAKSVTEIGSYAFDSCEKLCEVNYTDGLKTIGDGAFYKCLSLSVIKFKEGLTSIGSQCFFGCTSLSEAMLPKSLETAGDGVFANCTGLVRIDCGGLKEIPNSMCEKASSLLSVDIGNKVTRIGERAFRNSKNLKSVTIGKNVEYIGDAAFEVTPWISSQEEEFLIVGKGILLRYNGTSPNVVIPNEVRVISDAFEGLERVQSVTIGSKVTMIASYAFNGCVNLSEVIITAKVTSIENAAFLGCISLKSIELPNTLKSIGNNAFGNCTSLSTVVYKGTTAEWGEIEIGANGNVSLYSAKIVYEG